jgi:hypothetical protein
MFKVATAILLCINLFTKYLLRAKDINFGGHDGLLGK